MTPYFFWLGTEAEEAAVIQESYEQLCREAAIDDTIDPAQVEYE